jgi:hypothetical protein
MKKLALVIGINYPGTNYALSGCINDAKDLKKKLTKKGYAVEMLLDSQATLPAVTQTLRDMFDQTVAGDSIWVSNSSHGTQVPDESGDEVDHIDEAVCLWDGKQIQILLDDDIWRECKAKQPGVKMVWFSDSCFGGGAMRLISPMSKGKPRFVRYQTILPDVAPHEQPTREPKFATEDEKSPWPFLWMAGSAEIEPCYDANYGGRPNGAFTYTALKVLDSTPPGLNYLGWYNAICRLLPTQDYPQHPLMSGSYQNAKIFS